MVRKVQFEGSHYPDGMSIRLFPIDQLWHHCHLQQVCWFSLILAILDHLEQERFWKAAVFFSSNDQNKCCFTEKPKKGAPGRHRYIYIYIFILIRRRTDAQTHISMHTRGIGNSTKMGHEKMRNQKFTRDCGRARYAQGSPKSHFRAKEFRTIPIYF